MPTVFAVSRYSWGRVVRVRGAGLVCVLGGRRMVLVFVLWGGCHDAFGSYLAACVTPTAFACSLNAGMT